MVPQINDGLYKGDLVLPPTSLNSKSQMQTHLLPTSGSSWPFFSSSKLSSVCQWPLQVACPTGVSIPGVCTFTKRYQLGIVLDQRSFASPVGSTCDGLALCLVICFCIRYPTGLYSTLTETCRYFTPVSQRVIHDASPHFQGIVCLAQLGRPGLSGRLLSRPGSFATTLMAGH